MNKKKANGEYEVLCPWADVDPLPLRGIAPRVIDLAGKKVGFLTNKKAVALSILTIVERKLKERFPTLKTSWFRGQTFSVSEIETERKPQFEEWLNGLDAVVSASGD